MIPCLRWPGTVLPCDYRPGTPSTHPDLGTAFHPACLEAVLHPLVIIHHPGSGGGTVCGLPAIALHTPDLKTFPQFSRVICRGCAAPTRPLPADGVLVHVQDVAALVAAVRPVAGRLGITLLIQRLAELLPPGL